MFNLTIDSRIHFILSPATRKRWPGFVQDLKADMVIPNPEFALAEKHGRYTGRIPKTIPLWKYNRGTSIMSLPRGYGHKLTVLFRQHGIEWDLTEDNRVQSRPVDFGSKIQLRDYQAPAVEAAIRATGGILQAPAGSGKTEMGLEIISRLGQPALWLTHTKDLANQAIQRASKVLGLRQSEIGLIGDGVFDVGRCFTIGIIQTLARLGAKEMDWLGKQFGTVILDEAHHGAAPTWMAVMNQLPARYRYGVTATFERADGLEVITERVIGPTFYKVERAAVADRLIMPHLETINTGIQSKAWDKYKARTAGFDKRAAELRLKGKPAPRKPLMPFNTILNDVLDNEERNQLIAETLLRECPGHHSLVLSKRVEHCIHLAYLISKMQMDRGIKPALTTGVVHGKLRKSVREKILGLTCKGEVDILFAVEIAKEGLDIPRLDRLFLVGGGRNENVTEQQVGRIQRIFEGKRDAMVFDFLDNLVPPLRAQYWQRRKVYQRLGMVPATRQQKQASG